MSNENSEQTTEVLMAKLLEKHDTSMDTLADTQKSHGEDIAELKKGQTEILESLKKQGETYASLEKFISNNVSENPVGPSVGIPGDKGNAGKKEDAPNALAPDEKDPASGADTYGSDKPGLSGESKTKMEEEDKKDEEEKKKEDDKEDDKKEEKMKEDDDKKEDKKEEKTKGETIKGEYRPAVEKSELKETSKNSIINKMNGEGFTNPTPQTVKKAIVASILGGEYGDIRKMISNPPLKALPVGGIN